MNEQQTRALLVVEDSDEDFALTCWALKRAGFDRPIRRSIQVADTLAMFCPHDLHPDRSALCPGAVLLDLNLPDGSGLEVLEALRADHGYLPAPIVVITTSRNPRDVESCYRLGAAGYLIKPLDREMFATQIQSFVNYWFQAVTLPAP